MPENIESDKTLVIPPLASLSLARLVSGAGAADDAESRKPAASRPRRTDSGERQATRQGIEMQLPYRGLRRRQRQRQNIANGP